jgi:hypothetical protein
MQLAKPVHGRLRFRAARSAYLLLMGMASIPSWAALPYLSDRGSAGFFMLGLGAMALAFLWLWRFAIEVTQDAISYRTLWSGTRTLGFSDIRKAAVEMGAKEYEDRSRPTIRLALYTLKESGQEPIDINMKVFEREDVQLLLEHFGLDRNDLSIVRRWRKQG